MPSLVSALGKAPNLKLKLKPNLNLNLIWRLLQVETSVNEEHFALREAAKRQPGKPNELRSRFPTKDELTSVRERER